MNITHIYVLIVNGGGGPTKFNSTLRGGAQKVYAYTKGGVKKVLGPDFSELPAPPYP